MGTMFYITLALGCMLAFLTPAGAQEIIAHRGASYRAPENTLASVKLGYALGADAVEIDIHLSADKQLVVIHDKDTKRTADGRNRTVRETPYSILRELEVGSWKGEQYRGEKIPLLEEVLALVPVAKKLVIELKAGVECLPYLQEKIMASGIADRLVLISFDREAIIQAKQLFPRIPAYWLLHTWSSHSREEAIRIAQEAGLEGLDVHYKLVTKPFMQQMQAAGLQVYVYTVNDAKVARSLAALGVKGITTDRPHWLREQLQ
jgi:glycerophosphoryl diester phosphodiesterase